MRARDFGFKVAAGFPEFIEHEIGASLNHVANAFGLDPVNLGSGMMLSLGEIPSVELDQVTNRVRIIVDHKVNRSGLVYQWALALHKFNFIESYDDAVNHLLYTFIPPAEYTKRVLARWKGAEIGIQHTMESIFSDANDPGLAAIAMCNFNIALGSVQANSTDGAADMLRRLRRNAESLGCEIDTHTCALLALMIGMRAECLRDMQGMAKPGTHLNDNLVKTKLAYFSRMDALAQLDQYSYVEDIAPAIAVASYLSREMGEEFGIYDPRIAPTGDELVEISERIPAFAAEIAKRQACLFDADCASTMAPVMKLR